MSDGVPGIVEQAIVGGTALAQGRRVIRDRWVLSWKQLEQLERFAAVSVWNQFEKRTSVEIGRSVMLALPSVVSDWKPA